MSAVDQLLLLHCFIIGTILNIFVLCAFCIQSLVILTHMFLYVDIILCLKEDLITYVTHLRRWTLFSDQ